MVANAQSCPLPSAHAFLELLTRDASGKIGVTMTQHSTGDERIRIALELALIDPGQRQRLAEFFASLREWSLERNSQGPSATNERDSAIQRDQALLKNGSTSLAGCIGQEVSSQCFDEVRIPQQ